MDKIISPAQRDQLVALVGRVHAPLVELAAIDQELDCLLAPVMRALYVPENPNAYLGVILQIAITPLRRQILGHARGVGLTKLLDESDTLLAREARGAEWSANFVKQIRRLP